ncbi:glycosyltransferase involved in cell wall biosynthesis [Methanococcus maripaludis]|uniref:Glycosyltransferase involved in cell wall biosynthesis n=1 Tax=Methanococcus maripaludis TaxID=39152 RepID=A0A7J9S509_METMI|nr:glycosyltransferase [Methanococcus maripaludis]MBB6401735.1 glycosyltransferase involved in cell wall biosynthesis [Methanococcus maripaludis]
MKILITMGLADRSLDNFITPITKIGNIDEILIVRDTEGPKINKVRYITPPKWSIQFPILKTVFKFLILLRTACYEKPYLIHGFLLFPYGIMSYIVGKIMRKKIGISLIAGPVELYMPRGGSPIGKYTYSKQLPKIVGINKLLLYAIKTSNFVTVTGNFTKKFLEKNGVDKNNIFILPHVVDDRFKAIKSEKIYDLVYIGRLAKVKHVEVILKSIKILIHKIPNIKVAIVGNGPEEEYLKSLSNDLGLNNNVIFKGYQSDVWNWYNCAKISILASEREGFPYSVIESLSCGVPVITSNFGDVTDVVKNKYNGIIIKHHCEAQQFAIAIDELLNSPQKLEEYGVNALESIKNQDNKKIITIWNSILQKLK